MFPSHLSRRRFGGLATAALAVGISSTTTAIPAQAQCVATVLTLTNAADNAVLVGMRHRGALVPIASYPTGGAGTAAGLGSQGALAVTRNGRHVLAVNPGSDSVTLFRAFGRVLLDRVDVAPTGGSRPTSVAVHRDLVYVLNADSDDVTGFRLAGNALHQFGTFPLSGAGVAAAQVGFSPDGRHLVATERMTDNIVVWPVQPDGSLGAPTVNAAAAPTPFGFEFRRDGTLIVSEAAGGAPGLSAVSSYRIGAGGALETITAGLSAGQTAACWIALPTNGRAAYATNTGSANISGFAVGRDGALELLDPSGVAGELQPTARPIDAAFSASGRVLFVLDAANDEIVAFERDRRGGLRLLPGSIGLPDGAAGLLAR